MKNALFFIFFFFTACSVEAQSKSKSTLVGFQVGYVTPKYSSTCRKSVRLGIPSFSYAASLENRFSIHRKLNFSLQYSLNYFRQTNLQSSTVSSSQPQTKAQLGAGLQAAVYHQLNKRTAIYTGLSAMQPVINFDKPLANESAKNTSVQTKFNFRNMNSGLLLGLEKSTKLFNKTLFYSLQYNIGFFPFSQRAIQSDPLAFPSSVQSLQIGLKYKY